MINIRLQKISDAKRFYEILNNPSFKYFNVQPNSIEEEIEYLKGNEKRIKDNIEYNYTILKDRDVIGAIGVKIKPNSNFIGEIGYFLDEKYWGHGITSQAVKLIEEVCIHKLNLTRLEIYMQLENKASEKVAIKNFYEKEGILKQFIKHKDSSKKDCYLYAKIVG
ncbi:MAG: GNAT family N-acetyltransferase [Candidatus Gracilibacteria bacterium]|nr:GNAT family N-acetyltransferase [Candidatus Gracilibacteria bacterium]